MQGSQILEDSWWWQLENSGIYTTKSVYAYLVDSVEESQVSPLFKVLWKIKVPNKVNFLDWRAFRNHLPTLDNLFSRNIIANTYTLCYLCHSSIEGVIHLFFNCHFA